MKLYLQGTRVRWRLNNRTLYLAPDTSTKIASCLDLAPINFRTDGVVTIPTFCCTRGVERRWLSRDWHLVGRKRFYYI